MYCGYAVNQMNLALLRCFQWVASFSQYFPWFLIYLYLGVLRPMFVVVVGTASWLRNFSDFGFGFCFILGMLISYYLMLCSKQICFYPDERWVNYYNAFCAQILLVFSSGYRTFTYKPKFIFREYFHNLTKLNFINWSYSKYTVVDTRILHSFYFLLLFW